MGEAVLKLYQFVSSPFCAKVRKILDYKGLDYEIVEVDYLERKELLIASGQLMVPALTLSEGETIADSGRIAMRLEEKADAPRSVGEREAMVTAVRVGRGGLRFLEAKAESERTGRFERDRALRRELRELKEQVAQRQGNPPQK